MSLLASGFGWIAAFRASVGLRMAGSNRVEVLGLITARGGSKGLPGKNLRMLAGKPLIAWTIEAARQSRMLGRIVVSTDDNEIAAVARSCGADVPFMRPANLAQDDSPHVDAVLHALEWLSNRDQYVPQFVAILQPTSPLRTGEDIDGAVRTAITADADAVACVTESHDHPILARQLTKRGTLKEFVRCDLAYARRQALPPSYSLNGAVFIHRCESVQRTRSLRAEQTHAFVMPAERSWQIDTLWEFHVAELILRDRGGQSSSCDSAVAAGGSDS